MRVVSNTSPVSNLAILGEVDLLRQRFERVVIPHAVESELKRLDHPHALQAIESALESGWLLVEEVPDRRVIPLLLGRIDLGEAEAIELARQTNADLLVLDDLAGRTLAAELTLPYTGLLGLLAREKLEGRIPSLAHHDRPVA